MIVAPSVFVLYLHVPCVCALWVVSVVAKLNRTNVFVLSSFTKTISICGFWVIGEGAKAM